MLPPEDLLRIVLNFADKDDVLTVEEVAEEMNISRQEAVKAMAVIENEHPEIERSASVSEHRGNEKWPLISWRHVKLKIDQDYCNDVRIVVFCGIPFEAEALSSSMDFTRRLSSVPNGPAVGELMFGSVGGVATMLVRTAKPGSRMSFCAAIMVHDICKNCVLFLKFGTVVYSTTPGVEDVRRGDIVIMGAGSDEPCLWDLDEGQEFSISTLGFCNSLLIWQASTDYICRSKLFRKKIYCSSKQFVPGTIPAGFAGEMEGAGLFDAVKMGNLDFGSVNVVSEIFCENEIYKFVDQNTKLDVLMECIPPVLRHLISYLQGSNYFQD